MWTALSDGKTFAMVLPGNQLVIRYQDGAVITMVSASIPQADAEAWIVANAD